MMASVAARELVDGEVVFVGIGLPNLACNPARATHAPHLVLIYESGAVGAQPARLPVSIGDPALVTGSLMVCGLADVFQLMLPKGRIAVGFRGPGAGPGKVSTHQGGLEVDAATGELVLAALYPGVEAADVQARVGWPLECRPRLGRVAPPDATELRLLRDVLDPERLYLKG